MLRASIGKLRRPTLSVDRKGAFALEFGLVAPLFFLVLFFVFNLAYKFFNQEVLDDATQVTARQIQTGNAQAAADGTDFIKTYFCPNTYGLLNCNRIFLRVEHIEASTCTDFYDATDGRLPVVNGVLELGDYGGKGGNVGPTACATDGSAIGFCNAGPNETVLLSAVYVAPSFLGGLLPPGMTMTYGGNAVSAMLATAGFETENFASAAQIAGAC